MKYKQFKYLSKQEQTELKTAHLLGLGIEAFIKLHDTWYSIENPSWTDITIYRVKPDEK